MLSPIAMTPIKKIQICLLIFLISLSTVAQNHDKLWNKVVAFENEGKTKSAYAIVQNISSKAAKQKDEIELIKCFFYKSKHLLILEEDAQNLIIQHLQEQIEKSSLPSKALLNLVYARCLTSYYNKNNYKLHQRTQIDSAKQKSISLWTAADFLAEIDYAYDQTLEQESLLKNTPLKNYEPLFDYFSVDTFNQTSLYDYLLQANLDYYSTKANKWNAVKKLNADFERSLLGTDVAFKKIIADSIKDNAISKIIRLYQKANSRTIPSELELDRLLFCNDYLCKNDFALIKSLNSMQKRNTDSFLLQKILYEKADLLNNSASKNRFPKNKIIAVAILDSIVAIENKSNTYKKATIKKNEIAKKSLDVKLKAYTYNKENCRAFIDYKNVDSIKVTFYKSNFKDNPNKMSNDSIATLLRLNNRIYAHKKYTLKNYKDYFDYSTEVLLPQLEIGSYWVRIEDLSATNAIVVYKKITVTNTALFAYQSNGKIIFQAVDRKTGAPMADCEIRSEGYNLKTDSKGTAEYLLDAKKNSSNYYQNAIKVIHENDTLDVNTDYLRMYGSAENEDDAKIKGKVDFFLDRGIYRPGQTLFYKGIATQIWNNKQSVLDNFTLKVIIEDANGTEIKSYDTTTNEFGSFTGEFLIPKNGITGAYKIEVDEPDSYENDALYDKLKDEHAIWDNGDMDESRTEFRVEEYKRPKFEVTFEPLKESFVINQSIKVNGLAKAFAGIPISDAKVLYYVERHSYSNWKNNYSDTSTSLVSSETKTDAKGNFTVEFKALADDRYDKKSLPVFNYIITAVVTDNNGETHTAKSTVRVGYHTLELEANIPKVINTKDKNMVSLNSKNLNNQFIGTTGELALYYCKPFGTKFKQRCFTKPDISLISEEDFNSLFPYEKNDANSDSTDKGSLVYSKKVNTAQVKILPLDFISDYQSGHYRLVFKTTDAFNNLIETESHFEIATKTKNDLPENCLFRVEQVNKNPQKDGFVTLKIDSVVPSLFLSCVGNYQNTVFYDGPTELTDYHKTITIPLEKCKSASFKIVFETLFDNQYFKVETPIFASEEPSKITFETTSFRDRLAPGHDETWSFTVKENEKKAEVEVLASLYDSSLDQFNRQDWKGLQKATNQYNNYYGKTSLGFGTTYLKVNYPALKGPQIKYQNEYTKLMWFGFDFSNSNNPTISKEYKTQITKKAPKPANAKLISGYINDRTGPLPGANVLVQGTSRSTQTDFDGYFEIEAAENEQLIVSFTGYNNKTVKADQHNGQIILLEDGVKLEEVVVTGYESKAKKAYSSVASTTIQNVAYDSEDVYFASDIVELLQGKAPGLTISNQEDRSNLSKIKGIESILQGNSAVSGTVQPLYVLDGVVITPAEFLTVNPRDIVDVQILKNQNATTLYGSQGANGVIVMTTRKALDALTQIKTRTNRNETAFFFPQLRTDKEGKISFQFTTPEELTQWKLRLLAHNRSAVSGYLERSVVTQKELMVFPNMPRFLRENDTIVLSTKISNLTPKEKRGIAVLQLYDAATMQNIDSKTLNTNALRNFTITAMGTTVVSWKVKIPEGIDGIDYKVIAKADNYSDGEESILPVLTNSLLVTESIPVWVRPNSKKEYVFENLLNSSSPTLQNHLFTLEYTNNPAWFAIQSLPYLMEYEHDCAEQLFSKYYSNVLATEIISSNPKIAAVFEAWKKAGKSSLKLEQNESLKAIILAETPWALDLQNEAEQQKKLAVLFDLEQAKSNIEMLFQKLKDKQKASGGFAWFEGGTENEYISRHILTGLGHLKKLKVNNNVSKRFVEITKLGMPNADAKFISHATTANDYNRFHYIYADLHYLYMRSFYLEDYPLSEHLTLLINTQLQSITTDWQSYSLYNKALASLILYRFGEKNTAKKIVESLKETASNHDDWGMYWIENKYGWQWYESPIETQALLIEAFTEITNDTKSVDEMKVWLVKNKQTKNWPTTKATTEAIYALLLQGSDWLSVKDKTKIKISSKLRPAAKLAEADKEAEVGYSKSSWQASEINKDLAKVSVQNNSDTPCFGGIYWQYFEKADKVKANDKGLLSVSKELYLKKNTANGVLLTPISSSNPLKIGDLVTVKLIIQTKEDMDFIHIKDLRAACFEPVNVLSQYEWNDNLSYYISTKDASTHFFFDHINKGSYTIEYDLRINNKGDFSNGITTIESMYAPEYTSHTKGIRLKVTE